MKGVDAAEDMAFRIGDAVIRQGLFKAIHPRQVHDALRVALIRAAQNQVQVPVSLPDQMLRRHIFSQKVIVDDVAEAAADLMLNPADIGLMIGKAGHQDKGDAELAVIFQPGGDGEDARQLHRDKGIEDFLLSFRVRIGVGDNDDIAGLLGLGLDALQNQRIVWIGIVRHQNADGFYGAVAEIDGQVVR